MKVKTTRENVLKINRFISLLRNWVDNDYTIYFKEWLRPTARKMAEYAKDINEICNEELKDFITELNAYEYGNKLNIVIGYWYLLGCIEIPMKSKKDEYTSFFSSLEKKYKERINTLKEYLNKTAEKEELGLIEIDIPTLEKKHRPDKFYMDLEDILEDLSLIISKDK